MKVIALLSGGKDSIYNLHHCILNHHEPVCVASLGPPEGQDELDSFMYQTVAHSGLATLAQALDLPFYSTAIRGKPLNQSAEYGSRSHVPQHDSTGSDTARADDEDQAQDSDEDETEDLYKLLKTVQTAMPEVEGVAAGAILSNYQRVRVEHVCARLGLTSIAYLWQRDQRELLNEMVQSGQESVLVKVAGAGLGVQHLGKTLAEMQPILHRLNERFETHVCGEGGEYETFTLDSPIFKKRLRLEETETIISNPDPHSTVAHLYLSRLSLVDKPDHPTAESFEQLRERLKNCVAIPEVLDNDSQTVVEDIQRVWEDVEDSPLTSIGQLVIDGESTENEPTEKVARKPSVTVLDGWLSFSAISASRPHEASGEWPIEDELAQCFAELSAVLSTHSTSLLSLSHLNLLLSSESMYLFPRINKLYATYFGISPPTRACVSVRFPPGDHSRIKIEGVAKVDDQSSNGRTSLHVQSLSYWGAANIGPYSQAITVGNRCFIAGQIPLIPSSLSLPSPSDFPLEVALALQHVKRIVGAAQEGRWNGWCEGGICWIAADANEKLHRRRVRAARQGWRQWNRLFGGETDLPIVFVSAAQLPRSASVEWQLTWQTGQVPWRPEDDTDSSEDERDTNEAVSRKLRKVETRACEIIHSRTTGKKMTWQCSPVRGIADSVIAILACSIDETERPPSLIKIGDLHSVKAFYRSRVQASAVEKLARTLFPAASSDDRPTITLIGSDSINTLEGCETHDVAFVLVAKVLQE